MTPVIICAAERPELGEEPTNRFCRTVPAVGWTFAGTTLLSGNRADVARVSLPTLVLQCSRDGVAPLEVGKFVHAQIPGSRLVTLNATGPCPQLSAPGGTAQAVAAFVVGHR
jgi:sigma-B regulation protein RsbQ